METTVICPQGSAGGSLPDGYGKSQLQIADAWAEMPETESGNQSQSHR